MHKDSKFRLLCTGHQVPPKTPSKGEEGFAHGLEKVSGLTLPCWISSRKYKASKVKEVVRVTTKKEQYVMREMSSNLK